MKDFTVQDVLFIDLMIKFIMTLFWPNNSSIVSCFFQVCYARVLDYRRKFIEAAQRYHEISFKSIVDDAEKLEALQKTLICTILASAGL